jgi:hypothetical protein
VFGQDELDEAEAARVARVRITHDGRVLYFSIFAEDFSEVFFLDFLSEAGDEQVGTFIVLIASRLGRRTVVVITTARASTRRGTAVASLAVVTVAAR